MEVIFSGPGLSYRPGDRKNDPLLLEIRPVEFGRIYKSSSLESHRLFFRLLLFEKSLVLCLLFNLPYKFIPVFTGVNCIEFIPRFTDLVGFVLHHFQARPWEGGVPE